MVNEKFQSLTWFQPFSQV